MSEKKIIDISNRTYNYLKEHLDNKNLKINENKDAIQIGEDYKEGNKQKFKIFKPMPAPIDKIQNRYRYRIIIKGVMNGRANEVLNNYLKEIYQKEKSLKDVRISIDVNPNNMA